MTTQRDYLYGLPGAEELAFDPESIIDQWLTDADENAPIDFVIEEWSVHPSRYHLPSPDSLIEWLEEQAMENGEIGDYCEVHASTPEIRAMADALLDAIAATIGWRMANNKLRDLHVTGTFEHPLLDGEPVWRPRVVLGTEQH